ncbi:MAG: hypothetical protein ACRC92_07980 [Peptostreptococcaceae bacterium]
MRNLVKLSVEKVDSRKYRLMNNEVEAVIESVIVPGSNEPQEGKILTTANLFGFWPKGKKLTEIDIKVNREFYNVFLTEEGVAILALDEEEANEMLEPVVEEEIEDIKESKKILTRKTVDGNDKKRLSQADKDAYKAKFEKDYTLDKRYLACKTIKDKAIFLMEENFPISAIAYVLDKRFQQIRSYAVAYYGSNLKAI